MKDQDIIRKNLDIMSKNGDLYDAISLKEGANSTKYPFLKFNILFLSRILYMGIFIGEKIKQKLAPIKKVKKAQEEIRSILGVNVDIVHFKEKNFLEHLVFNILNIKDIFKNIKREKNDKENLVILYQDNQIDSEAYLNNLIKIRDFMQNYNLDYVYLSEEDILNLFDNIDLSNIKDILLNELMNANIIGKCDKVLLVLNKIELNSLINKLKDLQSDIKEILNLGKDILDPVIKRALERFLNDKNINKLKEIVASRLELKFNNGLVLRDKMGKIYENVKVYDEFLNIVSRRENGELLDNITVPILQYVENNSDLGCDTEQKELNKIIKLYLFILKKVQSKTKNIEKSYSFYDQVYNRYIAKKEKRLKKINGISSKTYVIAKKIVENLFSFLMVYILFFAISLAGFCLDDIQFYCFKNEDSNIYENITETIIRPYKYFWNIEKQILDDTLGDLINSFNKIEIEPQYITTGDVALGKEVKIAEVSLLETDTNIPKYYAEGYANNAIYQKGNLGYLKCYPYTLSSVDIQPVLGISYDLNEVLVDRIINNTWNFAETLYPVGDNYVLTSIVIKDLNSDKKCILWYDQNKKNYSLLPSDKSYLKSFTKPEITYYFGISSKLGNTFINNMKVFYTGTDKNIKEAIAVGLGLDSNAPLEEVILAIKNKYYSLTPIKDAGLSGKVKKMDKEEYFKCIASLDSLICNLAASLVVEYADDLAYVVGYMDNGDGYITSNEAHAWAMDNKGKIIDATPNVAVSKEDSIIQAILSWGLEKNIPIYLLIALIGYLINILFGEKIVFKLKVLNLEKVFNNSKAFDAYAKINEILYGGVAIPKECSLEEFLEKINWDFISFEREELEDLKEKLKDIKNEKLRRESLKIVKDIPFIKDNFEELTRRLKKD